MSRRAIGRIGKKGPEEKKKKKRNERNNQWLTIFYIQVKVEREEKAINYCIHSIPKKCEQILLLSP
jgi:prephenate dehydratase